MKGAVTKQEGSLDPFPAQLGPQIFSVSQGFYIMSVVIVFICSLGNRPQGSKWLYNMSIFFFAIIMILMLYVGAFSIINTLEAIKFKRYASFADLVAVWCLFIWQYFRKIRHSEILFFLQLPPMDCILYLLACIWTHGICWHHLSSICSFYLPLQTFWTCTPFAIFSKTNLLLIRLVMFLGVPRVTMQLLL